MNGYTGNLSKLLYDKKHLKTSKDPITHTRIGNKSEDIYGGSYCILENDINILHQLITDEVILKNKYEYLTEKQQENGPIAIDLDFRYEKNITTRKHDTSDMTDIFGMFSQVIKKIFNFKNGDSFDIYGFEKPQVNICENETKDGIHIIIGIQSSTNVQKYLRTEALKILTSVECPVDLPITNTWDEVFDEGVTKGHVNWQVYGSRKPGNEQYKLTNYYTLIYY